MFLHQYHGEQLESEKIVVLGPLTSSLVLWEPFKDIMIVMAPTSDSDEATFGMLQ